MDNTSFRRMILENPHDDAPRLVYADWLEEQGDVARAEFVRVQVELASAPECDGCGWSRGDQTINDYMYRQVMRPGNKAKPSLCRACILRRRERDLLEQHGREWVRPVKIAIGDQFDTENAVKLGWDRGFISAVTLPAAAFVGGPCLTCDGVGRDAYVIGAFGPFPDGCPKCTDGRTPGLAAKLFAAAPILSVVLTDGFSEYRYDQNDRQDRTWRVYRSYIGADLWLKLCDHDLQCEAPDYGWREYPTRATARLALSRVCVAYGRTRAKLPALAWPGVALKGATV